LHGHGEAREGFDELANVATLDGQTLDVICGNEDALLAPVGGSVRGGVNGDGDLHGADLHLDVSEDAVVGGVELDVPLDEGFEARVLHLDRIGSSRHSAEAEEAGAVALGDALIARGLIGQDDLRLRNDGAGDVVDGAGELG